MALRLVIIDDNRAFLSAATKLLEAEGMQVVGVGSSADDAMLLVRSERPDLVLLDVQLGADNGFEVARDIAAMNISPPVVLTSSHAESDLSEMISDSPAIGFLTKSQLSADTLGAYYGDHRRTTAAPDR